MKALLIFFFLAMIPVNSNSLLDGGDCSDDGAWGTCEDAMAMAMVFFLQQLLGANVPDGSGRDEEKFVVERSLRRARAIGNYAPQTPQGQPQDKRL